MTQAHAFTIGTRVRVQQRPTSGHVRTPSYLMGRIGVVERQQGHYRSPEELAYGKLDGALRPLYTVRFAQRDLWPDYGGQPHDTLVADIFEHWLEATD